jgi:hypothetical protein
MIRAAVLTVFLLPYAWFGLSDNFYHAKHRHVPWPERMAHAAIVLALLTVVPQAYLGNRTLVVAGLVLFVIARAVDEYAFHRGLPAVESALHARTHLAFLTYVVSIMAADWAEANGWQQL